MFQRVKPCEHGPLIQVFPGCKFLGSKIADRWMPCNVHSVDVRNCICPDPESPAKTTAENCGKCLLRQAVEQQAERPRKERKPLPAKKADAPATIKVRPQPGAMIWDRDGNPVNLENQYHGASLFLVLSGPSLKTLPLEMLQRRGVVTMALNNAAALVRPNLWTHGDPAPKFHDSIWRDPFITKFTPRAKFKEQIRQKVGSKFELANCQVRDMPNVFGYERTTYFDPEKFLTEKSVNFGNSSNEAKGNKKYPFVLSTFPSALKIAYYLGFSKVYLLGCDFEWIDGQQPYAFNETRPQSAYHGNRNSYNAIEKLFGHLQPMFLEKGFQVYNCNPKSRLETFPQIDFNIAIQSASAEISQVLDTEGWYTLGQ